MRFTWIMVLTLAAACGDDKDISTSGEGNSSGEPTSGTTSTSTTSTTSTPTTTDPSGTMGGSQTMGETTVVTGVGPGTTTDASTGTSDGTTGGGGADVPGACEAVCEKGITECMIPELGGDVGLCSQSCLNDIGVQVGTCGEAITGYLHCIAGLECMAFVDAIVNGNQGACEGAAIAADMACGGGGACMIDTANNPQMTECSLTITCSDPPGVQEMLCVGKQCACLVDGQKVGMCMAQDICMTPDALEMKAFECCGFTG